MTRRQKTVAKILEFKEFTTDQLEAETKKARARLTAEEERLTAIEKEYKDRSDDFFRKQSEGKLAVHEMGLYYTYLKHLGKQIEQQKGIIAIRVAELQERQKAMVEAYKEQRLLEKLQDKMHGEQVREENQDEQKESDYLFLMRKGMK